MSLPLPIETERLVIRRYTESDYDDLLKLLSRPDVARFLLSDVKTADEVRESLRARVELEPLDADGRENSFAVELRETGQYVGDLTFFMINTEHRLGEIGFVFHPDFHGRGYGTEAAVELLRLGFEHLKLHRMIGRCDGRNTASAALMRRLGMRQEAHFVRNEFVKGEWVDELVFAMLDDEWAKRG